MMMRPLGQCLTVNLFYANIQGNHYRAKGKALLMKEGIPSFVKRTAWTERRAVEVMVFTVSITSRGTSSHSALTRSIAMRQVSWIVAIQNFKSQNRPEAFCSNAPTETVPQSYCEPGKKFGRSNMQRTGELCC